MQQVSRGDQPKGKGSSGSTLEVKKVLQRAPKERSVRITDEVEVVRMGSRDDLSPAEEGQLAREALREYVAQEQQRAGSPEAIRATMVRLRADISGRFQRGLNQLMLSPQEFFRFVQDLDHLREFAEAAQAPVNTKEFNFGRILAEVERTLEMYPALRRDVEALKKRQGKSVGRRSAADLRGMPVESLEGRSDVKARRSADQARQDTAARIGPLIEETLSELEAGDQPSDLPAPKRPTTSRASRSPGTSRGGASQGGSRPSGRAAA